MGQVAGTSRCTAIMSASFPLTRLPVTPPSPRALAPLSVAMRRAVEAGTTVASFATPLASMHATFISAMTSSVLLEDAPSVPIATFTPAFTRSAVLHMPLASFRLLDGQVTTEDLASPHQEISSSVKHVMCTATRREFRRPSLRRFATGVHFSSLMWQLFESLSPAALAVHSSAVSCRCMWKGTSSLSLSAFPFARVASEHVYGEWSATVHDILFSSPNFSFVASPFAK
mmetsp:Transcript_700/g.2036  ORF Transcript_700/g.2036 Transcript_700/m.2036 type:complete len:229 (+) Transcript_700:342-1028(+)